MNIQVILLAVALVMLYIELLRLATRATSGDYTTKVKVVTVTATAIVAISLTIAGVNVVSDILDDMQKDEEIITSSREEPSAGTEKKIIIESVTRTITAPVQKTGLGRSRLPRAGRSISAQSNSPPLFGARNPSTSASLTAVRTASPSKAGL